MAAHTSRCAAVSGSSSSRTSRGRPSRAVGGKTFEEAASGGAEMEDDGSAGGSVDGVEVDAGCDDR